MSSQLNHFTEVKSKEKSSNVTIMTIVVKTIGVSWFEKP